MFVRLLCFVLIFSVTSYSQCPVQKVQVVNNRVSPPIGSDFISFSVEVDVILEWTDKYPNPPRASFINLMKQLGPAVIRVGGDSTDYSWYNPNGLPYPPYRTRPFRYNITDIDIHSIYNSVQAFGGSVVFGVNFRPAENASYAINHLLAIDRIIGLNNPSIKAIEIGNEVDLYRGNGDRPASFSPNDYYLEWKNYIQQIQSAIPHAPTRLYQGATYCCYNIFEDDLKNFITNYNQYMRTLSVHFYPDNTNAKTTLLYQLSDQIAQEGPLLWTEKTKSGNFIKLANTYGIDVVIGEGNTNSEPGELGVCDVFGSAIWVIDEFLNEAKAGIRRYHIHTHELDLRTPFYLNQGYPIIRPVFYGLRFFAYLLQGFVAPPQILETDPICVVDELIKTWAVLNGEILKIVLIHKNLTVTGPANVEIDLSNFGFLKGKTMYAIRLIGEPTQKVNIMLAGQTWTGSKDGYPVGVFQEEKIMVDSNGLLTVTISPINAMMISSISFNS